MDLSIQDKRALVLASSAGIGRGIAAALIDEGVRVALCARPTQRLDDAGRSLGAAVTIGQDLSERGAGARAVARAIEALGGLDILVTNCGGPPKATFGELSSEDWEKSFHSLWMSAVDAISAALDGMVAQGWGRVLVVTSSTGREPFPGLTLSNAFRPGLHGLVNSVSKEVARAGVTVNAIMPGTIDTERMRELGISQQHIDATIPAGRLGRPEEIGALAAFLASEHAGYISGQAIACDGARLASI